MNINLSNQRSIRIFVSSPNDVSEERRLLNEVITTINGKQGAEVGVKFETFRWEHNVAPQIANSPQAVIDANTPPYDIYLGIMASRFGTPTGEYGSGTEKEFHDAEKQWDKAGKPWIMFYFKETVDTRDLDQAQQVLQFKERLIKKGIVGSYKAPDDGPDSFKKQVADHLLLLLKRFTPLGPFMLLTSVSSRRKALLEQVGYREGIHFFTSDGSIPLRVKAGTLQQIREAAVNSAIEKVNNAVTSHALYRSGLAASESIIVGADTVVWCPDSEGADWGRVLDRPILFTPDHASPSQLSSGRETAREMLMRQRGAAIYVITGLAVALADNIRACRTHFVETKAWMKNYSDDDIEGYLRSDAPLFLAGSFGIQEKGVALFEKICGSYSNVVGLPLVEFMELLHNGIFRGRYRPPFTIHPTDSPPHTTYRQPSLSVMAIGDINFDLTYDEFAEGFFRSIQPPGNKQQVKLQRQAGGTAVNFAAHAKRAGFDRCAVLGVIGDDELGRSVYDQVTHDLGIESIFGPQNNLGTSIAIVLRDVAQEDTSLTVTDARQSLNIADIERASAKIKATNVLYVSGYALVDPDRHDAVRKAMQISKDNGRLVVLDVVAGMSLARNFTSYENFKSNVGFSLSEAKRGPVDVLVAEIPDVMRWFASDDHSHGDVRFIIKQVLPELGEDFPVVLLRTKNYSLQVALYPNRVREQHNYPVADTTEKSGLVRCRGGALKRFAVWKLDYAQRPSTDRLGYGDEITAKMLYKCMAPELLLASRSPRRMDLMHQIVANNKIEVRPADVSEGERQEGESPEERVQRLAWTKAKYVLERSKFSPTIKVVIGADTEIVLTDEGGVRSEAGNPGTDPDQARAILRRLSGKVHEAITGVALIHTDRMDTDGQPISERHCEATRVRFRNLTEEEIDEYVQTGEPLEKAGAYAIQGRGALLIERIEGSYSNVVGLPLEYLTTILAKKFDIRVWDLDLVSNWQPMGNAP